MKILLQPKQRALLDLIEKPGPTWIGYGGSRGGAKSYAARAITLWRAACEPKRRFLILRRTWPLVRENHVEPMRMEFPELFRTGWNEQNRELRLSNGSTIAFRYAENQADVMDMIGKEYYFIVVDQAESFTEKELTIIKSCCRCPRAPDGTVKMLLTFNPGDIGMAFLKRVFVDHEYRDGEMPTDYAFLQAYGWDNGEWGRDALASEGKTLVDYYSWPERDRYEFYITRTQYGRSMNALPHAQRIGWLLGEMGKFAGQFYDCFDPEKHTGEVTVQPWQERWIGVDWGFAHNSVVLWCSQSESNQTVVYREFAASGRSPRALAQEILDLTPPEERTKIAFIWLSHDAFARVDERDTIADQMRQVLTTAGLPEPWPATRDVIGSSALIYDLLKENKLFISSNCPNLIATLPMVSRDEKMPERPVKFEGDDAFDALRYALKDRLRPAREPANIRIAREAEAIADPVARWFYRRKMAGQQPAVSFRPRYVLPSGEEV